VYILKALDEKDLIALLQHALQHDAVLQTKNIQLKETEALINISGGDARKLLNLLELVTDTAPSELRSFPDGNPQGGEPAPDNLKGVLKSNGSATPAIVITNDIVMEIAQQRIALYDKKGEQHYDIISAFIKSIRGSDPNAAVYWLARMIEGGEDVKFIARRLLILASEDIGNANPNALLLANATFDAVNKIGYPESQLILSQCTVYLASSAKSNSATVAIGAAMNAVKQQGDLPVPLHIRNAPTKLMKQEGYGKGYEYAHNYDNNFSPQEYLPHAISGTAFYNPGANAKEEELRKWLRNLWKNKYGY
jgi:putative ATPase